ncbi:unnamed protein product [Miscanthus lutarioriparius]|uniref:Uncharacterized protein n=1 Tax=Miscanthus lutarioriparius TaxID=422564 RepID=A0A811RSZ7_9POAL|nr:unnamed protein product [Miscanthus lutarioriparius]
MRMREGRSSAAAAEQAQQRVLRRNLRSDRMESRGKERSLEQVQEHDEHVSKKRRHGVMGAETTESLDQIQGNSSTDEWCSEFEAEEKVASQLAKKPWLNPADVMVNIKSVSLLSTEIRSSLERTMQVWGYINKLLRHPESNKKIVVPKSYESWISMAMGYVRQDLDKIKELIGAPVLDKVALVAKIAKSLESWKMLLHGHAVSKEVSSLMRELEDLKKNLSDDDAKATKQSEEEQIMQGHRTTENNSLRSVTRGLASIKDYDAALDWEKLVGEAEERKRQRLSKVKELERALRLAQSDLSKEEEREANRVTSRARHSNTVSRVSEAVTDLAKLLAQTNTCWEAMRGSIQDEGISAQLWFQLKFVESCQIKIEGADDDE